MLTWSDSTIFFTPKFVKKYANVAEVLTNAFKDYVKDVREKQFPVDAEHSYKMKDEEVVELTKLLGQKK